MFPTYPSAAGSLAGRNFRELSDRDKIVLALAANQLDPRTGQASSGGSFDPSIMLAGSSGGMAPGMNGGQDALAMLGRLAGGFPQAGPAPASAGMQAGINGAMGPEADALAGGAPDYEDARQNRLSASDGLLHRAEQYMTQGPRGETKRMYGRDYFKATEAISENCQPIERRIVCVSKEFPLKSPDIVLSATSPSAVRHGWVQGTGSVNVLISLNRGRFQKLYNNLAVVQRPQYVKVRAPGVTERHGAIARIGFAKDRYSPALTTVTIWLPESPDPTSRRRVR